MEKYTIAWFSNETGEAGNEYKSAGYWGDKSTVIAIVNERNSDPRNIGESGRLRTIYSTVPVLEAALGMSDEPQAAVAITDDSAVDNTPSEPKREINQPETLQYLTVNQAGEPVWKSVNDLPASYEWQGGLITGRIVNTGVIEGTVKSGWLADALQTVNVTNEAVANDDYLSPTVEDNDDLPFSDNGQDEYVPPHKYVVDDMFATIASLEARVVELTKTLNYALGYIQDDEMSPAQKRVINRILDVLEV